MDACTSDFTLHDSDIDGLAVALLDVPGHYDTSGPKADSVTGNSFDKWIHGCGGFNALVLVMTCKQKANDHFQDMIKFYVKLFGEDVYQLMVVMVTGVDSPYAKDEYNKNAVQTAIEEKMLELTKSNIPVIPIGYDNFEAARVKLREFIELHPEKYEPTNIISPLHEWQADENKRREEFEAKEKVVESLASEIEVLHNSQVSLKEQFRELQRNVPRWLPLLTPKAKPGMVLRATQDIRRDGVDGSIHFKQGSLALITEVSGGRGRCTLEFSGDDGDGTFNVDADDHELFQVAWSKAGSDGCS